MGKGKGNKGKTGDEAPKAAVHTDSSPTKKSDSDDEWQVMDSGSHTQPTETAKSNDKGAQNSSTGKKGSPAKAEEPKAKQSPAKQPEASKPKDKSKPAEEPKKKDQPKKAEEPKKQEPAKKAEPQKASPSPKKGGAEKPKEKEVPKQATPVVDSSSEPRRRDEPSTRDETSNSKKRNGKAKEVPVTSSEESKQPKRGKDKDSVAEWVSWIQVNLKTILIVTLAVTVLIWVKVNETNYARLSVSSAESVKENLYSVLGVSSSANLDELKRAHKTKAAELHPDKNPGCVDCQDKFNLVTKAYETLSNPETRRFYDTTGGIVTQVKSSTYALTASNYHRLVEESSDVWLILVYQDNDEGSTQFISTWDEVAKEYPFIQFGRVNFITQAELVSMLPFKILEFPFVLSKLPNGDNEFFEYDGRSDLKPQLKQFIRDSIAKGYQTKSVDELKKIFNAPATKRPQLIQIIRNESPISYAYLSSKLSNDIDFFSSSLGDHKRIYTFLEQSNIDYVLKLPEGLEYKGKKSLSFRLGSDSRPTSEADHLLMYPIVKFLTIPDLRRSSFNEFCSDYTTSEDSQSIMPSVCVVALQSSSNAQFSNFINIFKQSQKELIGRFYERTRDRESDIFDAAKTIQFASLNFDANKNFRSLINGATLNVQNPRAFVYVSAINKIKFYNDPDTLQDDLEEIQKGNYPGFKHLIEVTQSEQPLSSFLLPDNASILGYILKSLVASFTSVFSLVLLGGATYAALTIGKLPTLHAVAAGAGLFVFIAVFGGLLQAYQASLL